MGEWAIAEMYPRVHHRLSKNRCAGGGGQSDPCWLTAMSTGKNRSGKEYGEHTGKPPRWLSEWLNCFLNSKCNVEFNWTGSWWSQNFTGGKKYKDSTWSCIISHQRNTQQHIYYHKHNNNTNHENDAYLLFFRKCLHISTFEKSFKTEPRAGRKGSVEHQPGKVRVHNEKQVTYPLLTGRPFF